MSCCDCADDGYDSGHNVGYALGHDVGYEDGVTHGWDRGFAAALDELESRLQAQPMDRVEIDDVMEIIDKMKGGTGE